LFHMAARAGARISPVQRAKELCRVVKAMPDSSPARRHCMPPNVSIQITPSRRRRSTGSGLRPRRRTPVRSRSIAVNSASAAVMKTSMSASASQDDEAPARGFSREVKILTLTQCKHYSSETWKQLANSTETLVFYMTSKHLDDLVEILLRYTRKPNTPLAVIEQATTIYQRVHVTTLKNCKKDISGKDFSSPSLVIIGKVVNLYQQFNWFKAGKEGSLFNELILANK